MQDYINEEVEDVEVEDLSIADVYFYEKTLEEYEQEFSTKLPAIPCSIQEMHHAISTIANAYQTAYNCSARLLVSYAKADKDYKIKRNELMSAKAANFKEAGAKKLPSKETIESLVNAENSELEALASNLKKLEMMKDWFDCHIKKLAQMLTSAKDISYGLNTTERMTVKGNV